MTIQEKCRLLAAQTLPRILSQIGRDENVPDHGCCDRNHHHYKIRDFSSIIIQQAGYAAWCASLLPENAPLAEGLRGTARAACLYWNRRALRFRAFEEYYPWEEGYPPVAFSTLAVAKLALAGVVKPEEIRPGLAVAARQLLDRFEAEAANQQVAGTSALCQIRKLFPELVPADRLEQVVVRTLKCQHPEGWYMEYGGQDLGYLSVTMDCLWDAFDVTGDARFRESAVKALRYMGIFLAISPRGIGMHNARNTDYVVPYGIARFLEDSEHAPLAARILRGLLENVDAPGHYFRAVDDRYWCHYIGHSLYRAVPLLEKLESVRAESVSPENRFLEGTGHFLRGRTEPFRAFVSGKKGGILTLFDENGRSISDFGWVVPDGGRLWVNHWWSDRWQAEEREGKIIVTGPLTAHKYAKNTPFRHMVLRGLSLFFGRQIIALLKEKLIFKKSGQSPYDFRREIEFAADHVAVRDEFQLPAGGAPKPARRASQRHVASADSFHFEDYCCAEPGCLIGMTEKTEAIDGRFLSERIYRLKRKDGGDHD